MTAKVRKPREPTAEVRALMDIIYVPDYMLQSLHRLVVVQLFAASRQYVCQYERHLEAIERVAAERGIDLLGNPG